MKILLIPDTQCRPGVPLVHLNWIGHYIAEKKPDAIVLIGDHYDLSSLSSYDKGTKRSEGKRLGADLAAGELGLNLLTQPYRNINGYRPRQVVTLGNHEQRLERHRDAHPELADILTDDNCFAFRDYRFEVVPFLVPIEIAGIQFCHYFCRGPNGQVMQNKNGMPSARMQVQREMKTSISGHRQGFDYAVHQVHDQRLYAIIAGSAYLHEEGYLSPQGTAYWRGICMLHDCRDGQFELMQVSLDYLCGRYTGRDLSEFLTNGTDLELMRAVV